MDTGLEIFQLMALTGRTTKINLLLEIMARKEKLGKDLVNLLGMKIFSKIMSFMLKGEEEKKHLAACLKFFSSPAGQWLLKIEQETEKISFFTIKEAVKDAKKRKLEQNQDQALPN